MCVTYSITFLVNLCKEKSLTKCYRITPDNSVIMMYTFYQSVYYSSHNQSLPSTSEHEHAFWVGFGEHVGDAITHKLLDSSSNKILYRSAVHPADDLHPNKHLLTDLGEPVGSNKPKPIHLINPVRMLTNVSVDPWLNIIQMTA